LPLLLGLTIAGRAPVYIIDPMQAEKTSKNDVIINTYNR
jgi:hypothetical protein